MLFKIEEMQAKLLSFLDEQRAAVPRLYLLSNEALLVLLSLEGHPNECMPYIRQLFPGLQELGIEFRNGGENQAFTSMRGRHGERVSLPNAVLCDGAVHKWIVEVETAIQVGIACLCHMRAHGRMRAPARAYLFDHPLSVSCVFAVGITLRMTFRAKIKIIK